MAIEIGDAVYILKQRPDFSRYQVRATVIAVQPMRMRGKHKVNLYSCVDADGNAETTFYKHHINGKLRVVIRKTPFKEAA